jgi:hypothetical protein
MMKFRKRGNEEMSSVMPEEDGLEEGDKGTGE